MTASATCCACCSTARTTASSRRRTARRADIEARSHKPDLLLVDLGLPDGDGIDVIQRVRAWSPVPIIVLSARTREAREDRGARCRRRRLRDQAVQRRRAAGTRSREPAPQRARHRARRDAPHRRYRDRSRAPHARTSPAGDVHFTPLEYRVLECLVRHAGMIVRPEQLLREAWGPGQSGDTRTLRVCIKNLRDKLEPDPRRPQFIVTETGLGYRLVLQ